MICRASLITPADHQNIPHNTFVSESQFAQIHSLAKVVSQVIVHEFDPGIHLRLVLRTFRHLPLLLTALHHCDLRLHHRPTESACRTDRPRSFDLEACYTLCTGATTASFKATPPCASHDPPRLAACDLRDLTRKRKQPRQKLPTPSTKLTYEYEHPQCSSPQHTSTTDLRTRQPA